MKSLQNYIFENKFNDILTDQLYKHIAIEFNYNFNYTTTFEVSQIFEKLGSFENSGKIVMYIFEQLINKINNNDYNFKIDCKELNTFFDNIIINIHYSNSIEGEYYNRENNDVFMNLIIPENIDPTKDWEDIMKIILHELLHAYEDYNRKDSIFDYLNSSYYKSIRFMKTSYIENNKKLFEFGYFFNDQERNAYFSNIYNDVEKVLKKLNMIDIDKFNYNEFIDELKNTDIWKTYFDIGNFIMNIDNLDNNDKNQIIQTFNFIKANKLSFKDIKKELKNKWNKFESKFNQLVPKCICDIITVPNRLAHSGNE